VPTTLTQSVIPVGGLLFIVAQLFSLPEVLRQARGAGIVDHEQLPVQQLQDAEPAAAAPRAAPGALS